MYEQKIFFIVKKLDYKLVPTVFTSLGIAGSTLVYLGFQNQIDKTKLLQQKSAKAAATQISADRDNLQRQIKLLSELRGFTSFDTQTQEELVNTNSAYKLVGSIKYNTSKSNYQRSSYCNYYPDSHHVGGRANSVYISRMQ